ncbi:hypothetical protein SAMN05421493_101216 [Pseudobutyrivibrio sp. 49]|uniref:hypothetical protein n=1 Tax=unclassified Pseudobutyrivibrio TaxID=2638619 RepID=UPI000890EBDD|nr:MULTISPECIES: hypothetical protein [unclassified Pseudobutyrivibrio]SDH30262.1 hypothetical protein SAMN05421493_101216 [Pseudobutyrivibrio sp. 49]SFN50627.1 hypothetical protein SAMN04487831_101467 [Pseudobutyrivibrio sp. UC1225]
MDITASEKKVLNGISFNTEEIESGNLRESDATLLNEMRAVENYLIEKYPSFTFEITGCEPKSGTTRTYSEWYFKSKEINRESAFIAMSEENDKYFTVRDAFFGQIIREPIKNYLEELLTKANLPVITIEVSFWEYLGEEYGEEISAEKVLTGEIDAGNDFKIFLDGSKLPDEDYQAVMEKIKTCLQTNKISGEVYLVILSSCDGDFARDRVFSDSILL